MKTSHQNLLLITAVQLGTISCQYHQLPQLTQTESSFRFYNGPETASPKAARATDEVEKIQPGAVLEKARPKLPLTVPLYPDLPVAERRAWITVGVHLNIDANGIVTDITPSLVCVSTPHPKSDEFFRAVQTAVATWRFSPARLRHMEMATGADGSTWWRASHIETIETAADVTFTFTASGKVLKD